MNSPENYGPEPSPDELAEKFKKALRKLGEVRSEFIKRVAPGLELTEEDQEEIYQLFEAKWIERSIRKINLPALGWTGMPVTSGEDSSDLDASADLFIDVSGLEIIRYENTSADDNNSDQYEIRRVYRLDPIGHLIVETNIIRESLEQRGEPSFDEAVDEVKENFGNPRRFERSNPILQNLIDEGVHKYTAQEAQAVVSDFNKVIDAIIELYEKKNLAIYPDLDRSHNGQIKYKIEDLDAI